jgi:cell division septation protein DedD
MLGLFFALVVVCALFFGIGFSLGRKGVATAVAGRPDSGQPSSNTSRPAAGKNSQPPPASSDDFSFYKAVGQKKADSDLAQPAAQASPTRAKSDGAPAAQPDGAKATLSAPSLAPGANPYFVQIAAVTRQEDADALVEALKNKQYPAFSTTPTSDKYFRVQIGPFADIKEAEQTRSKLLSDGYNPIVKR